MKLLRSNIIMTPLKGAPGCKLYDQHEGKTYEFGEIEQYLIEQIQKPYQIDVVAAQCNERFSKHLSEQDIDEFLSLLEEWNLLYENGELEEKVKENIAEAVDGDEESNTDSEALRQGFRKVNQNQWHLFNPQRMLDSLNRFIYPFRKVVWLTPFILVFAMMTALAHFDTFTTGLVEAKAIFGIVGRILLSVITINLISQIAHGLVARHYQLPTPSFGVVFMLGIIPRLNIQTQMVGNLNRSARIWLAAIPSIMSLLLFSFATILWAVTLSSGSFLASIYLEMVFVAAISFIFMANPFFGIGVTLWSELLKIPNLRKRSKLAMAGLFISQPDVIKSYTKEHRMPLVLYGLVSVLFIFLVISFIAYLMYSNLEGKFQGAGVAIFMCLVVYILWFRKKIKKRREENRQIQKGQYKYHMPRKEETTLNKSHGLGGRLKMFLATGWKKKFKRGVFLMLVGIVMILPYHYETSGKAEVYPISKASISFETSGIIDHIFVDAGDHVDVGDRLASIANYKQLKDVEVTEATIRSKRFEIEQYLTTPSFEEIQVAKAALKTAELQFKYSSEDLKRLTPLYKKGVITLDDYEAVRKDADLKRQEKQQAKLDLESLLKKVNPNQIESLKAEVKALEQEAKFYQEALRRTYLISPIQGQVITENIKFKLNSYIATGDVFAEIENTSTVSVRVAVPESDIGEVTLGAVVSLKLWAYPDMLFSGRVTNIEPATAPEETDYGRVIYVSSNFDNPNGFLISGLTGHAKITGNKTLLILAFSRAFMRFIRVEVWSWLP